MRIAYFCFILAALAGISGISLGIYMGMTDDFSFVPAHAHVNLLGWVTMSLYGLYHRGAEGSETRLAWVQVVCGGAGFPVFAIALALVLVDHNPVFIPFIIAGALLCWASMALFLAILVRDARLAGKAAVRLAGTRQYGW